MVEETNDTDWDAAAEVEDVEHDVPEYTPPTGDPAVSSIEPVDVKQFVDAVEHKSPIEQANEFTDKLVDAQVSALEGAPVSNSDAPINLADPAPEVLSIVHLNGVDVISTPDRIQVVRAGAGLEPAPTPAATPVMTERMADKILAEQEAGRRALQRNQERSAAFPRPARTAEEVRREGKSVAVFRPGDMANAQQRHLLNTPTPKKGEGY